MAKVIVAEFDKAEHVVAAAERVRALGFRQVEAFSPFPIPELDEALAIRRTRLPLLVLLAGASGAGIALAVQWWTNAIDFPIDVGGRPTNSLPTHVLIVFETTVLFASITAFVGALVASGLPRLHDPVFDLPGFERTTLDRFWITIRDGYLSADDVRQEELAKLSRALAPLEPITIRDLFSEEEEAVR